MATSPSHASDCRYSISSDRDLPDSTKSPPLLYEERDAQSRPEAGVSDARVIKGLPDWKVPLGIVPGATPPRATRIEPVDERRNVDQAPPTFGNLPPWRLGASAAPVAVSREVVR
ncbi:hypothetical protein CPLU01_11358 [Colletotrichum plurivorum]|uniref:Uncharacterized protein n=1 Tax=Colletotrichum plurivorum TaxID=2175906 RepID=A0A8H6K2I6_9PEZI|nr:hypothetical protein CPLU01_11358 [Colletotrichum plurivorum]